MEIAALSNSVSVQTTMGMLLVKVLDQTQALIQQHAAVAITQAQAPLVVDDLGENLDVIA